MSLDYNGSEENDDVLAYIKTINNNDTLCLICHHDETTQETPPASWDRYEFKCGHKFHSRCLRRWCYFKSCVNCPICGDINMNDDSNYYCNECERFGHHSGDCPKIKAVLKEFLRPVISKAKRRQFMQHMAASSK